MVIDSHYKPCIVIYEDDPESDRIQFINGTPEGYNKVDNITFYPEAIAGKKYEVYKKVNNYGGVAWAIVFVD